jgi:hypothetical protein
VIIIDDFWTVEGSRMLFDVAFPTRDEFYMLLVLKATHPAWVNVDIEIR